MLAQRIVRTTLRHVLAPARSRDARLGAGRALIGIKTQQRLATNDSSSASDYTAILAKQRLNRPVSPHLSIYQPQITWYGSITNRITGSLLSGGLYVFAVAYLVAPTVGWHLESAALAASFGALPLALKLITKVVVAWPFAYHALNGVRHLAWDVGLGFKTKTVQRTGWAVAGLSVVSAVALAFV